ncbi:MULTISPECIES: hypothetical protein [Mesorhizobium]|uniref:Tat pathway signal sequence domain protein n=1 Tax=Mesorhizobium denitrificans TaxID=2294114 RepID=A0A371XJY4_9HYPH|nr:MULTISPECIES: hypothetical protein [Mesorhizobium]RFC69509.1 hypothetical protein DY251_01920 [Mesorhizobium denitrificans]
MKHLNKIAIATAALHLAAAAVAHAQTGTAQQGGALSLELNAAQPSEKGCRLTFVVNNGLSTPLKAASFELVLFNKEGVVDRITALAFKDMPAGKTKVSRFDLSDVDCTNLGRVLINAVTGCEGEGIAPETCSRQLKATSKAGVEFGT